MTPPPCRPRRRSPYQALVFDFDGTLAALTLDFLRMRQEILALAVEFLPQAVEPNGTPVLEWLDDLAGELQRIGRPAAASELLLRGHAHIRNLEVEAALAGELFPFTRDLLGALQRGGIPTAIITRNCRPALDTAFPDALSLAGCLLTRDDVRRVKPHPEHLGSALAFLACPPGQALMVGDHPLDIRTGQNSGVDSAGVASGRMSQAELQAAGACHVAPDCLALCRDLVEQGLLPPLDL